MVAPRLNRVFRKRVLPDPDAPTSRLILSKLVRQKCQSSPEGALYSYSVIIVQFNSNGAPRNGQDNRRGVCVQKLLLVTGTREIPNPRDWALRGTKHALVALALAFQPGPASPALLQGKAVSVADGDTITVIDSSNGQHRIRLAGIDAPELGKAYGRASKKYLAFLIAGGQVAMEWEKGDRYGRVVGKVWAASPDACPSARPECPKTLDVGLAQITVGLAWHFKRYAHEQLEEDRERYAFAEKEARARKAGYGQGLNHCRRGSGGSLADNYDYEVWVDGVGFCHHSSTSD